ncbi:sulfotransferase [Roseivivax lentus]|nr:sulfotransferase [Roseivivax lentus]
MLEAGGVAPVADGLREANEDNPMGYYEFEPVKDLDADRSWVAQSRGRAVKVIYKLVYDLPMEVPYKILLMRRDVTEVVRSQEKMLVREGRDPGVEARDMLVQLFQQEMQAFSEWAAERDNIEVYDVDYAGVVGDPERAAEGIAAWLGLSLDTRAMAEVVNPDLYRNRA